MAEVAHSHAEAVASGVPPHVELQREVDSMQAVYTRERRELEVLARALESEVQGLREQLQLLSCPEGDGEGRSEHKESAGAAADDAAAQWARQVCWRLDGVRSFPWEAPDPARCSRQEFQLPECPGVDFGLAFFPFGGSSASAEDEGAAAEPQRCRWPRWRLALELSGATAEGLRLAVQLSARLEASSPQHASAGSAAGNSTALGVSAGELHVASATSSGGYCAEWTCEGLWPRALVAPGMLAAAPAGGPAPLAGVSATDGAAPSSSSHFAASSASPGNAEAPEDLAVMCCAELTVLGWEAATIRMHSDWKCVAEVVSDTDSEGDGSEEQGA